SLGGDGGSGEPYFFLLSKALSLYFNAAIKLSAFCSLLVSSVFSLFSPRSDFATCLFSISIESNLLLHKRHANLFWSISVDSSKGCAGSCTI
ncbi:hypothetical protein BpHYR1_041216, partial [Brachionus plicatilis]